jgi:hypothetical protein
MQIDDPHLDEKDLTSHHPPIASRCTLTLTSVSLYLDEGNQSRKTLTEMTTNANAALYNLLLPNVALVYS